MYLRRPFHVSLGLPPRYVRTPFPALSLLAVARVFLFQTVFPVASVFVAVCTRGVFHYSWCRCKRNELFGD